MVIINWNTEWASIRSARSTVILQRIFEQDPEIVCLTEAYLNLLPDNGHVIASEEDYGYPIKPGRRKVLLWSKRPWANVFNAAINKMPPGRYVYGETKSSLGLLGVHGLCIPWADAHVRTGARNRRRWEDHLRYLSALPAYLDRPECRQQVLVGDYNQRLPRRRAPLYVHQALSDTLSGCFTIATEGVIKPINQQTVDHVATNDALRVEQVESLSNITTDGRLLSDHFGITAVVAHA